MSTFIDFVELKEKVCIEQVIELLQLNLKKSGKQLRGCCPIHDGTDTKEFVVTPEKGLFYCFKCKEGGDLIKLYAAVKGMEQKIAAVEIAQQTGASDSSENEGDIKPAAQIADEAASDTKTKIKPFPPLQYLLSEHKHVQDLGITPETAEHFGAGYAPKGVLRGNIAIPIHDREGTLLGYTGRCSDPHQTMLTFAKGFDPEPILFNAHRCEAECIVDLREDPLDVLLAYQHGIESNIVTFLTERISARQVGNLALFLDDTHCYL